MDTGQDIWAFESVESVQLAAAQSLQDLGVVIPCEESSNSYARKANGCFGLPVDWDYQETLPCNYATMDGSYVFQLPKAFVECVNFLLKHTDHEGLFRKAGSVSRQKALRASLEDGISIPDDANIHDVAAILKQYLRMLPDPLLTKHLSPVFEACVTLVPDQDQVHSLLLTCLLLPAPNLQCLCVFMNLLKAVSDKQKDSLMSSSNLAIIIAPNLIHTSSDDPLVFASGNALVTQTSVIQKLIDNSALIGHVPHKVGVASARYKDELGMQASQDLEGVMDNRKALPPMPIKKNKKCRTSSLSGIVLGLGSRLKQRGTAMFLGDTANSTKKRAAIKRKERSHEDLLGSKAASKMKISLTSNVEQFRNSLQNRRATTVSKPKPRRCISCHHSLHPRPTITDSLATSNTTDFHMTPSFHFTKHTQVEPSCSFVESDLNNVTLDVASELMNSSNKIRHFPCESASPTTPQNIPLDRKLSLKKPPNSTRFQTNESNFVLANNAPNPSSALPTFAPPKKIAISPILVPSDTPIGAQLNTTEYTPHNAEANFTFSLPTPLHYMKPDSFSTEHHLGVQNPHTISQSPVKENSSLIYSVPSPRYSKLDQAFLGTPLIRNSPNLMDKINSEIAQRSCNSTQFWYSSYTPANIYGECLQPVNESYKRAISGSTAMDTQPQTYVDKDNLKRVNQSCQPVNTSIEDSEGINMHCPPVSLQFDTSDSSNSSKCYDSELTSEHSTKHIVSPPLDCTSPATSFNHRGPSSKFSSPSKSKHSVCLSKSPGGKLSTKMKATTTRKRYDYSATLGIGESLVQAQSMQPTKLASPSKKHFHHSACLGMTILERETLQRASKRAHSKRQHSKVLPKTSEDKAGGNHSSSVEHLCALYSPKGETTPDQDKDGSSKTFSLGFQSPNSPVPALLKILQTNVAQSQKKERAVRKAVLSTKTPVLPPPSLTRKALVDVKSNEQAFSRELMKDEHVKKVALTPFKKALRSPWLSSKGKITETTEISRAELYEVKELSPPVCAESEVKERGQNFTARRKVSSNTRVPITNKRVELKEWIL